jgi:hypothetical protein
MEAPVGNGAPAPASDGAATNPPAEQTPAADQEREQQALSALES